MSKKTTSKQVSVGKQNLDKKQNVKIRGEVWDLEPILGDKSFDQWITELNSKVEKFKAYRSILNNDISVQKFLEIVKLEENISVGAGRVEMYYMMKFCENTKDSRALAKMGQMKQITTQMGNDIMFFGLWFMQIDDKTASRLINSKELTPYKYHLELTRKAKKYTKSEEIEQIMSIKDITGGDAYAELYNILTNSYVFDWFGKKLSKEEVINYYRNDNPKLREKAYNMMLTRYGEDSTVLSEVYKNIVIDWCNDGVKIRGHVSSVNVRNTNYDVTDKSVETLLRVVRKNVSVFGDYFKLKYSMNKKAGQKYSYSRYHLYAPFITNSKKTYDYEYSKAYVLDTYKKFDKRFYDRAVKIFNEKKVHSHPAPTKRGGAFCNNVTRELTPYIMLNHTDSLKDMFTMIHELGHGVHDLFAGENQTDLEGHASLTICETASVFSEMVMADRLLKESKDAEEKKHLLVQLLDNQYGTIARQAYFVIFELYAHEQTLKGVTKEVLEEYYQGLLKEQFEGMEIPKEFKNEWNYIPHIHETPFYCYAYAWGNLLVLALYDMYKKEGPRFVDKYIELLSAGGSDSPANLMKKLGIDAESEEFWQRGFNIIKEEVDELRKLAK